MSNVARLFSQEDYAHARRFWIAVGVLIGFAVCTLLLIVHVALKPRPALAIEAKAERSAPDRTVAIPMVYGNRNFDCLITIDRVTGLYTVNCGE